MPEALAIVGMACRFPDANTPGELWDNVLARRIAFRRMPVERLGGAAYVSAGGEPDTTYVERVAVLEGYEFDRLKYRVSGEAYRSTDLSHWLALDVASAALQDAGFGSGKDLPGDRTGVLVGNTLTGEISRANGLRLRWPYVRDVVDRALEEAAVGIRDRHAFLQNLESDFKRPFPPVGEESLAGALANTIAGRICNHFDLGGGGYTVDGACSSSLLAVANACSALNEGDIDVALVGGVDLSLDPFELVGFAALGALSHGEMRVYDESPTGFLPGEGCGFAVLMRERDALAAARRVYARVSGWGISSDGSGGITRPEIRGQMLALRRAYDRAGISPGDVDYIEGHGTGTAIGDATELQAIARVRQAGNASPGRAAVGSIKANIGHTKAAAGIAGLIKTAMAVSSATIPPTSGTTRPHPIFADGARCLRIVDEPEAWPERREPCAGVSSFGFGGINVHLAVQGQGPPTGTSFSPRLRRVAASSQESELFLAGARDVAGLLDELRALQTVSLRLSAAELTDLAASMAARVGPGYARAAVVAGSSEELHAGLSTVTERVAEGATSCVDSSRGCFFGVGHSSPRIAFLFPGQAAPVRFSSGAIGRCLPGAARRFDRLLASCPRNDAAGSDIVSTDIAQPVLIAACAAGLKALSTLGIEADRALGHSLGELAALYWSGAIDEPGLVELAATRGAAMAGSGPDEGAMANVSAPRSRVEQLIAEEPDLKIAAINGPDNTVVSGDRAAVARLMRSAETQGIAASRLTVSHAFHTDYMRPASRVLAGFLDTCEFGRPQRPVVSTVTGTTLHEDQDLRALLVRQLTQPVLFADALRELSKTADLCLEVGSGSMLRELAATQTRTPVVSLDVGSERIRPFLNAVGAAFALGAEVDAQRLFRNRFCRHLDRDWRPSFIANPCATPASSDRAKSDSGVDPAPTRSVDPCKTPDPATAVPHASTTILEALRQAVAEHSELPMPYVRDDSRLLTDLHLNSIAVSQIVARVARRFDLSALVQPTAFSDSTLAEVANALEDLKKTAGPSAQSNVLPDGIGAWVRAFETVWTETPLEPGPRQRTGESAWEILSDIDELDRPALSEALRQADGNGVAVFLARRASIDQVEMLLEASRRLISMRAGEDRHLVVCQQGMRCASFAKTFYLEHPDVTVSVLDSPIDHRTPGWLKSELAAAGGFQEVRYSSSGDRHTAQIKLIEAAPTGDLPLGPRDLLLVTGGGKGIAAECAFDLAKQTGVRLLLVGRSSPESDSELEENLARFAAAGSETRYVSADVSDAAAVRRAVASAEDRGDTVTAILHGAGVNDPALIHDLDAGAFREICSPKVDGLRNVLAAVDPSAIRLLVCFGSIIARSGMPGEAHYGLANEWLARETRKFGRRNRSCRCVTLEWSVWSGLGMGDRLGRVEALTRAGISPISPDEGVRTMRNVLSTEVRGDVVLMGRVPDLPTLPIARPRLPLLRFVETPRVHFPGVELIAESEISTGTDPYLSDHVLDGMQIFPAVMAMEAMAQSAVAVTGTGMAPGFESVRFLKPIVVPDNGKLTLRVLARVGRHGSIDLAIRSNETNFAVDHVVAVCRFTPAADDSLDDTAASSVHAPPVSDAVESVYDSLLFHSGRFRRLRRYTNLAARSCGVEIETDSGGNWFSALLPQRLILNDPGARDAAIHAVQACIPDSRLLPIAIDSVIQGMSRAPGPWRAFATERSADEDTFTYDVRIYGSDGVLCESWRGLHLRRIGRIRPSGWSLPLLRNHLERKLQGLVANPSLRVALNDSDDATRKTRREFILNMLNDEEQRVFRRSDGKPVYAESEDCISISHSSALSIGVKGPGNVACDVEPVSERSTEDWADLLGSRHTALTTVVEDLAREDRDTIATRIWASKECLKKSGAGSQAPLTVVDAGDSNWVTFGSGRQRIATYATTFDSSGSQHVVAVLAGAGDASV